MRTRQLHVALREFCQQAGFVLAGAVAQGAEVSYEVVPEGGRGKTPPLYCYHALTGEFVVSQHERLCALETYLPALHALVALDGLSGYLDAHRIPHEKTSTRELAEAVLNHFVERVFTGAEPRFEVSPDRFEPAYRDLEQICVDGRTETVVLGLLRGLTTESESVPLGEGVLLAPPDCLEDMPPDPLWVRRDGPALVVAIAPGDAPGALASALERLRELQTALRLFAPGIALAPLAWVRGDGTPWRPVPLRCDGRGHGRLVVTPDQEDELRAFCSLVARRLPDEGPSAWALERFELGCEHADPLGGLTDHLLALRALLEPEGPQSGRLAGRIAALCVVAERRAELAAQVTRAIAAEQATIRGLDDIPTDARELAEEIEGHLRALLRDVVCGHLALPLDALADDLLLEGTEEEEAAAEAVEPESSISAYTTVPQATPEPTLPVPAVDPRPTPEHDAVTEPAPDVVTAPLPEVAPTVHRVSEPVVHHAIGTDDYEDLEAWGEPAPFQPELFS